MSQTSHNSFSYHFLKPKCIIFVSGPLPDQAVRSAGEALRSITPQFLISSVLHGLAELSLFDSSFVSLPRGSVQVYKCPPVMTRKLDKHPDAPVFP